MNLITGSRSKQAARTVWGDTRKLIISLPTHPSSPQPRGTELHPLCHNNDVDHMYSHCGLLHHTAQAYLAAAGDDSDTTLLPRISTTHLRASQDPEARRRGIVASFPVSTPSFFSHVVKKSGFTINYTKQKKSWEWRLGTRLGG